MAKETKTKEEVVRFMHVSNPYFYFTYGNIKCQFINSMYETSNPVEIKVLEEYLYNTNDLIIR